MRVGQDLQGKVGNYRILDHLRGDVWTAIDLQSQKVVVKIPPKDRFENEREILERVGQQSYIRPLIDIIDKPTSLILRYLDDNLLNASNTRKLGAADIKFVAWRVLEALQTLHELGYVHTDIKPDNILVDYGNASARFKEVQLGDCGDVWRVNPGADPLEEGHIIGAAIFRSPEAMLNLRWGTATDIWSFGATIISLIWGYGWHIFKPENVKAEDQGYAGQALIKQISIFGPVPWSCLDIMNEERRGFVAAIMNHIDENKLWKPFNRAEDKELSQKDRKFGCKIMKVDPRERPTAKELLDDEWFDG